MLNLNQILRDQRGIESFEWILVGGLIVGVAIALFQGVLEAPLTDAVTAIVGTITG